MKTENLLIGIVAAFAAFKLFGKSKADQQQQINVDEIKNKPLPIPPGQSAPPAPTLTRAEAQAIAERQYIAMWRPGTDENELYRAIAYLNGADLRLIYELFGRRNYYAMRRPLDLFGWYAEELTRAELDRMRIVWYKSGLTF
jgi:hypothetical protein